MQFKTAVFMTICALSMVWDSTQAKTVTISVPMNSVSSYRGIRGSFFIVSVQVPSDIDGKRLDSARVDFAIDVTALAPEDSFVTPIVGIFPLTQEFVASPRQGGLASAPVFNSNVPSARPVAIGESRVLRMDVTAIVQRWLNDPTSNHGLVIGTMTGPDVGTISLKDGALVPEAALRVTFCYQNRGSRVPRD